MVLLKNIKNIFLIPELTKKLLITLGIIVVYRIGVFIPMIGINVPMIAQQMSRAGGLGGLLGYLDTFSGGALVSATVFSLGIGPYITASIMMQMLTMAVPHLELLAKEGDYGRRMINQYTRYLTVVLSIGYSLGYVAILENANLVLTPGIAFKLLVVLSLTAGAMFVMWLGEQISLMGIGNGSSIIIFAGIVARFPDYVIKTIHSVQVGNFTVLKALAILILFLALTAFIVFLEKGDRKITVQYTRRIIGNRVYGGQSTYIPFKINPSGVLPAILSSAVLSMPIFLSTVLAERYHFFGKIAESLRMGVINNTLQFVLIFFFTFFYTALLFNAQELADQLKKSGGFIPTIRPGKQTADYFDYVLTRIALLGAVYLGILAILPNIVLSGLNVTFIALGGTSLLIVVGVALELASQIESYLIEHKYEGFLTTGRIKNRINR